MAGRILIADDEPVVIDALTEVLTRSDYEVNPASSSRDALDLLARESHDIVLCDFRLPESGGFELLREVRRTHPETDVLMLSGTGDQQGAVEAMEQGAADFLLKPLNRKEVLVRVRALLERRRLQEELQSLQGELRSRHHLRNIVAFSPRMNGLAAALRRIGTTNDLAVFYGERGTGRGFLCRALHYSSSSGDAPFAFISFAGSPAEESRALLFGRRTGDRKLQRGQLERTRGGTLVLRELESAPPAVQAEIGRALETRTFHPVDSDEVIALETRILVTLSASPAELSAWGRLDRGLSGLLRAVALHVPSLKERAEDFPGLIAGFLGEYGEEHGVSLQMSAEAVERLCKVVFPGNVAQVFAVLGQCAALSPQGTIEDETLELTLRQAGLAGTNAWAPMAEHLGDREKLLVMRAVSQNPGKLDQAAKELGVSRTTLWRRMRKYRIHLPALL